MSVQAVQYDDQYEQTHETRHPNVEAALAWCAAQAGEPIAWGDTHLGFCGVRQSAISAESPEWPPAGQPIWEVHGLDDEGVQRELDQDTDWADWDGFAL